MIETQDKLIETVIRVLEDFVFMFSEKHEFGDFPDPEDDFLFSTITFMGPFRGKIEIAVTEPFCISLSANALGVEPFQVTQTVMEDALKEFANILCGNLTATLFGEEPVFDLSVPTFEIKGMDLWREWANDDARIRFMVDEDPMMVSLILEES